MIGLRNKPTVIGIIVLLLMMVWGLCYWLWPDTKISYVSVPNQLASHQEKQIFSVYMTGSSEAATLSQSKFILKKGYLFIGVLDGAISLKKRNGNLPLSPHHVINMSIGEKLYGLRSWTKIAVEDGEIAFSVSPKYKNDIIYTLKSSGENFKAGPVTFFILNIADGNHINGYPPYVIQKEEDPPNVSEPLFPEAEKTLKKTGKRIGQRYINMLTPDTKEKDITEIQEIAAKAIDYEKEAGTIVVSWAERIRDDFKDGFQLKPAVKKVSIDSTEEACNDNVVIEPKPL